MNKEKIDLSKPKKEYKKFQKESESLVDELKIDKEEQEEEILEEELEAKFWEDLYKEKLEEVLDDKEAAIGDLEDDIKSGKGCDGYQANGYQANWALRYISNYKNLGIFDSQADESLKKVLDDKDFKNAAISYLENKIRSGKNGDGADANWALRYISNYKNLGIFDKKADESLKKVLDDKDFKNAVISNLENKIKSGKNGDGWNTNWAIRNILTYKNISEYWQEIADQKITIKVRKEDKDENIPKRPEEI